MKKIVRYFGLLEIILIIFGLGSLGSGAKNIKQKRELRKQSELVHDQSKKISKLSLEIDRTSKELKKVHKEKEEVQDKLDNDVKRDMSIAFEQASDIEKEHRSPYTSMHLETMKEMIKTYGYDAMARIIKWNMETIRMQQEETRNLKKERDVLRTKYNKLEKIHMEDVYKNTIITKEHETETLNLKNKIKNALSSGGFFENLLFWGSIAFGVYIFLSFGGITWFFKVKNKIKQEAQEAIDTGESYRKKLNANNRLIKSFTQVNDDGNDLMKSLLDSHGIDLDKKFDSKYKKK